MLRAAVSFFPRPKDLLPCRTKLCRERSASWPCCSAGPGRRPPTRRPRTTPSESCTPSSTGRPEYLAAVLAAHFKGVAEIQALPDASANYLLISAAPSALDEVVQTLNQIDRPPQTVSVEILIVSVAVKKADDKTAPADDVDEKAFSGPIADVKAKVEALQKKGALGEVKRLLITAVEGQPANVTVGENKPYVVGMTVRATGMVSRSIAYRNTGTQADATVRVLPDKVVSVDLKLEDSRMIPSRGRHPHQHGREQQADHSGGVQHGQRDQQARPAVGPDAGGRGREGRRQDRQVPHLRHRRRPRDRAGREAGEGARNEPGQITSEGDLSCPDIFWPGAAVLGLTYLAFARPRPAPAEVKRTVVVVQHRPAKDLADLLRQYFAGAAEIQAVGNDLLIRAAPPAFDDVIAAVGKLDREPRTVSVEVLIAEAAPDAKDADFRGPAADVAGRMEEMRGKGGLTELKRVRLTLVEGRQSSLLAGDAKPSVAGIFSTAAGRASRAITYRNVGADVQATATVTPDGLVAVDLHLTDVRARVPEDGVPVGVDEKGKQVFATEYLETRWNGRVDVPDGQARVVQDEKAASGKTRLIVVVTAQVVDPEK